MPKNPTYEKLEQRGQDDVALSKKRLESLWGVAQMVDADFKTLCNRILEEILVITGSQYAFYGFLNKDESVMTLYSWSKNVLEQCQVQDKPIHYPIAKAGIWADAVRERKAIVINDYQADSHNKKGIPEGHVPMTRLVSIPVFSHDRIVALAVVANKESEYVEDDVQQIRAFVTAVQVILDRQQTEEELRKLHEKLEQRVKERTAELATVNEKLKYEIKVRKQTEGSAKTERDKAQQYLDIAGVVFVVIDRQERIILVNRKGCEVLEALEKEIIGQNWFDRFVPERMRERVRGVFQKLMRGELEPAEYFENPVLTATGQEKIIAWHNTLLKDKDKRIIATLSSGEDITKRKLAERDLRESNRELKIRNQIAQIFLTTSDEEMYGRVLKMVLDAMESKYGTFAYIDENGDRIVPTMTRGIWDKCKIRKKDIFFPRETWGNNLWARCLIEKRAVSSNGPFRVPDGHISITTALAVPIIHRDEAIGNFMVGNKATGYDQRDVELLTTIADNTAPILDSWLRRHRHETERRLKDKEIKNLARFPAENPNPVLRISQDGNVIYANAASFPLLDVWGCQVNKRLPHDWHKIVLDVLSFGISKNAEIQSGDRTFSLTFAPIVKADYVNLYGLDITERKRAEDMLREAHDELERRVQKRTAELQRVSSLLLEVQESERKKIALELHDSVGQSLAAIKFVTENSLNQLSEGDTQASKKTLESLIALAQRAGGEVRRIHADLRPSLLDDLGIISTVSWFCREFEKIYSGIRIEKQINIKEKDVPESLKIVIFRIMQEALNNVSKHAEAKLVTVSLNAMKKKLELVVEDTGQGFDYEYVRSPKRSQRGFGLISMKERVELSGGTLVVDSGPGTGTVVKATWPI
jgi:PAS domain S-box-containing protein